MHIPDKYRDRYDRLALTHPWMREMRDEETNGIDGETNGIHADAPLVDGDAMEILRRPLYSITDIGRAIGVLGEDEHVGGSGDASYILDRLADMFERDYVRRDDYDFTVEMLNCMKTERDEWKAKAEGYADALEKLGCSVLANGTVFGPDSGKSAKRAAAVERLKSIPPMDTSEIRYVRAILGSVAGMTAQDVTRELIDLLTDDDANDDSAPENDVSADNVDANDGCATCNISGENVTRDREALDYYSERYAEMDAEIAELTAKVDEQSELIAARGKTIEALERFMSERKLKLKKQLENKTEQCRKLKAERDEYRELYEAAMSTDYAQVARERDEMSGQIEQIRSILNETTHDGQSDD